MQVRNWCNFATLVKESCKIVRNSVEARVRLRGSGWNTCRSMEPTRSSGAGSGNSGTYTPEAAETLRFEEEIQSLMRDNLIQQSLQSLPPGSGGDSSFTALLGLPPSQAVELLHESEPPAAVGQGDMWQHKELQVPLGCSPTFPSNAALVERAARFSVFAAEDPAASNSGERPSSKPKSEPADYGDAPICPVSGDGSPRSRKRKDGERSKAKGGGAKKGRSSEEDDGGDKLPYVHVRARRGQATDSHSLAERARREKINARMKLLQELVPGCSKITGTALVLDETINHVQTLQRQVELLSMRLAAVNPRIDFNGLDSFLSAESRWGYGRQATAIGMVLDQPPALWSEGSPTASSVGRRPPEWVVDMVQQQGPPVCWERKDDTSTTPHGFVDPAASLFSYDSASSVSLPNQMKTEL